MSTLISVENEYTYFYTEFFSLKYYLRGHLIKFDHRNFGSISQLATACT